MCKIMMAFQIKDLEIISPDYIFEYTRIQKRSVPIFSLSSIGGGLSSPTV